MQSLTFLTIWAWNTSSLSVSTGQVLDSSLFQRHGREMLIVGADKQKVEAQFEKLIAALDGVGLRTEVRDGANGNVLVFVRVRSEQKLVGEVYRSRYACGGSPVVVGRVLTACGHVG